MKKRKEIDKKLTRIKIFLIFQMIVFAATVYFIYLADFRPFNSPDPTSSTCEIDYVNYCNEKASFCFKDIFAYFNDSYCNSGFCDLTPKNFCGLESSQNGLSCICQLNPDGQTLDCKCRQPSASQQGILE